MEKLKTYKYFTSRGKFGIRGKVPEALKVKKYSNCNECYKCRKVFEINELQLEHFIPVMAGGHLFEDENCFLICKKCHNVKTGEDMRILNAMKGLKIIESIYSETIQSYYSLEEIKTYYLKFKEILKINDENRKVWLNGENGTDYEEIFDKSNRSLENE